MTAGMEMAVAPGPVQRTGPAERFAVALGAALVPGLDAAAVRTVLGDAALAPGSTLTGRGVPFEASVTGCGAVDPALRWVVEAGSSLPFFGPRFAAQRRFVAALVARLPVAGRAAAAAEIEALLAMVVPDTGAVPARSRRALYAGVVQRDAGPLAAVKVYAHVDATVPLVGAWADLGDGLLGGGLLRGGGLRPAMVAVEVGGDGDVTRKLYLCTTRALSASDAAGLVDHTVPGAAPTLDLLAASGFERWWHRPVFVALAATSDGRREAALHGRPSTAGRHPDAVEQAVRALARRCHGGERGVDALVTAGAASGSWSFTMVGLALAPGGAPAKLNLYAAPNALDGPT